MKLYLIFIIGLLSFITNYSQERIFSIGFGETFVTKDSTTINFSVNFKSCACTI